MNLAIEEYFENIAFMFVFLVVSYFAFYSYEQIKEISVSGITQQKDLWVYYTD